MATQYQIDEVKKHCDGTLEEDGVNGLKGPCPNCGGVDRFHIDFNVNLFGCRGGCTFFDILEVCGVEAHYRGERKDNTFTKGPPPTLHLSHQIWDNNGRLYLSYNYFNSDGAYLGSVVKKKGGNPFMRHYDFTTKQWNRWATQELKESLYNYRSMLMGASQGETIYICEGEKDVSTLFTLGLMTGTTNSNGALSFNSTHAEKIPEMSDVVIVQDNDPSGRKRTLRLIELLKDRCSNIRVLCPQHMGFEPKDALHRADVLDEIKGQDITDYLDNVGSQDMLWLDMFDHEDGDIEEYMEVMSAKESALQEALKKAIPYENYGQLYDFSEINKYDVSSASVARKILLKHGDEILLVNPSKLAKRGATKNGLCDSGYGIWTEESTKWRMWIRHISDDILAEAQADSNLKDKGRTMATIANIKRKGFFEDVQSQLGSEYMALLQKVNGKIPQGHPEYNDLGVTVCDEEDLNVNLNYIGCNDRVIDLSTGQEADEPRSALITKSTVIRYNPDARDKSIDSLFAHLDNDIEEWWWNILGYHLRFGPDRRFYAIVGPKRGGKSTLASILTGALGPYCATLFSEALDFGSKVGSAMLSPERLDFLPPHRFALVADASPIQKDWNFLKRESGGDRIKARGMWQNPIEQTATATIMFVANPESVPGFKLDDDAVEDRFRELPYNEIPRHQQNPVLKHQADMRSRSLMEAFLCRLIQSACKQRPGVFPAEPASVIAATKERKKTDGGDMLQFAKAYIKHKPGGSMTCSDLWDKWCNYNGDEHGYPNTIRESGNIKKSRIVERLSMFVDGMKSKSERVYSKAHKGQVRGIKDYVLSDDGSYDVSAINDAEPTAS